MYQGSIPALVTPFTSEGAVDEQAFAAHVEWQISEGSSGLVPVGTTGESPTLSHDEHKRVVELCVEVAAKRVPVIAGAGSNNTVEAIELAQHAEAVGADALLVVTPYYNKPTQKGLIAHYKAIAEATSLPIIIYNIPGRSVIDMSPETMGALAKAHKNIVGVKDATGKIERVSEQRITCGPDFVQLRRPGTTDMIDLIVAKTDYQELVIQRATPHGDHLRVATPEDLIVLKLIANRSIDHIDADALARHNPIDWPYVEHWAEVWQVTERLDRLKAGLTPEA